MVEPERKKVKREEKCLHGFEDLPDEVCLLILRHLSQKELLNLSEMSVRLRGLSLDSEFWKELDIDSKVLRYKYQSISSFTDSVRDVSGIKLRNGKMERVAEVELLAILSKFKHSLTSLELADEVVLLSSTIEKFKQLENLKVLAIAGSNISKTCLNALSKLKHLEEIRFPSCTLDSGSLTTFFRTKLDLRLVDVSDCQKTVNTKVLMALGEGSPRLEHLVLDEAEAVNSASLKVLSEHCPRLKHLSLEGCDGIGESSLVSLVKKCTQLRYLSLGMCRGIGDRAVRAIASNLVELEHLDVYACSFVGQRAVKELLATCKHLKYLNVRGIPLDRKFIDDSQEQYKDQGLEIAFYATTRTRIRGDGSPLQSLP